MQHKILLKNDATIFKAEIRNIKYYNATKNLVNLNYLSNTRKRTSYFWFEHMEFEKNIFWGERK